MSYLQDPVYIDDKYEVYDADSNFHGDYYIIRCSDGMLVRWPKDKLIDDGISYLEQRFKL